MKTAANSLGFVACAARTLKPVLNGTGVPAVNAIGFS
ncbi:hypothetical protein M2326_002927 [Flavobacterium sp. 7A]|nr:hypothetical protein [Flavobacterium sp. 7A]